MRENARLEFDRKLVSGDSSSTDEFVHNVLPSCDDGNADILQ